MKNGQGKLVAPRRSGNLLGEGVSALFLLLLMALVMVPETLGHALFSLLRLISP